MDRRGLLGSICGAFVALLPASICGAAVALRPATNRRRVVQQKVTSGLVLRSGKPGVDRVWLQDTESDNRLFPIVIWDEFRSGAVVSGRKYIVTIEEA